MSRGFVKEDDQEEAPFIPPRAPLPEGAINYVTPRGLQLLVDEKAALERAFALVQGNDMERRREHAVLEGKLALLNERIGNARPVDPVAAPDEVRFGTTVTFHYLNGPQQGTTRSFTIVGVDEANVQEGRIAFTAPIARALTGKRVGEVAQFSMGATAQELRVESIR